MLQISSNAVILFVFSNLVHLLIFCKLVRSRLLEAIRKGDLHHTATLYYFSEEQIELICSRSLICGSQLPIHRYLEHLTQQNCQFQTAGTSMAFDFNFGEVEGGKNIDFTKKDLSNIDICSKSSRSSATRLSRLRHLLPRSLSRSSWS